MKMPMQIYVDASFYGGIFDVEFQVASRVFFDEVRKGVFNVVVSPIILDEIACGPDNVRSFFCRH